MGRKRKPRGKAREPITISLERDLIIEFDKTLGDRSRSRTIESMIKSYLRDSQAKLEGLYPHHYECLDCHRQFTIPKFRDPDIMVCSGSRGCGNVNIKYHGLYYGDEEE